MAKPDFKKFKKGDKGDKDDAKDASNKKKPKKEVEESQILAALESIKPGDDNALANFGLSLIESVSDFSVASGTTVAAISDPTYPFEGVKGKVKGPSAKGSGFVDVEFPNGTVVPMQSSLLIPV